MIFLSLVVSIWAIRSGAEDVANVDFALANRHPPKRFSLVSVIISSSLKELIQMLIEAQCSIVLASIFLVRRS